ncbi:hypothetical protein F4819DRAFT_246894 [Hypoxylon fuscum]|nr:hypothetical protein F4819DRAFT_246894 [Hypoxylon fuscum]
MIARPCLILSLQYCEFSRRIYHSTRLCVAPLRQVGITLSSITTSWTTQYDCQYITPTRAKGLVGGWVYVHLRQAYKACSFKTQESQQLLTNDFFIHLCHRTIEPYFFKRIRLTSKLVQPGILYGKRETTGNRLIYLSVFFLVFFLTVLYQNTS